MQKQNNESKQSSDHFLQEFSLKGESSLSIQPENTLSGLTNALKHPVRSTEQLDVRTVELTNKPKLTNRLVYVKMRWMNVRCLRV